MTDGKTDCKTDTDETDETSRIDLLLDDALLARVSEYASMHGMSVDALLQADSLTEADRAA